jgi:hypothetical protein
VPKGPRGEKRPTNPFEAAVMVGRIATGEIEDAKGKAPNRAKGGKVGGAARAKVLTTEKRREIAKKAAKSRWGNQ